MNEAFPIQVRVNGVEYARTVEPRLLLSDFLREDLGLTGTHVGCEHGICGCCTIRVGGDTVRSCLMFAVQADGLEVTTIEGLADSAALHPIQEAFWTNHGLQCGFCTPGMLFCALELLKENPDPSDREIREGISGTICRCTGYHHIVLAVKDAARRMAGGGGRGGFQVGDDNVSPKGQAESVYFEPEIETASRETMRRIQEEKFLEQVRHTYANSPFYRKKMDGAGVEPEDVRSLDDIGKLPFTTKDELKADQAEHPPWGSILAVPFEDCLRVHSTSATTGRPVMYLDTASDWEGFYRSYARGLYGMGIRKSDMVMCAFSYGPWIGFWAGFYAAQTLGCLLFPAGGFTTEQRIDALLAYPITVLGSTPSYALYMAEEAKKRGIDLAKDSKIRITWHTGEPGASIPATKKKIEGAFGAEVFDLPGLTELAAWGFSCTEHSGIVHVHEDYCLPEVLDLESGDPVGPGEEGELVFTSLYRKAMPLLRYRTRDVIKVADRACPCGRTLFSIEGGVLARLDDMKKIRGVIVYPKRIEEIVRTFPEMDEFMVHLRRKEGLDEITVEIDPSPEVSKETYPGLKEKMESELRLGLGIRASVEIVESGALPRWDHKARRVKDEREEVPF